MTYTANLGFPRIGIGRELKKATEDYWKGRITRQALLDTARSLRTSRWQLQKDAGIHFIPSNDFSFYDHVLDTTAMLGAVPGRFGHPGGEVDLDTYFAMARGNDRAAAMDMTKWFDTNYHYIVPELEHSQIFHLGSTKIIDEFLEAKNMGILTRPVLLGPITYLRLSRTKQGGKPLDWLDKILPIYAEVIALLTRSGAAWIQIDEPVLALDMSDTEIAAFQKTYRSLLYSLHPRVCMTSYFGSIADKFSWLFELPLDAVHLDLVRAPEQLVAALKVIPATMSLSLGEVNGRNIWKTDLSTCLARINAAVDILGKDRIMIASSCSMLHCPIDLEGETSLRPEIRERMAFARQKLDEIRLLGQAIDKGPASLGKALDENQAVFARAEMSTLVHNQGVKQRIQSLTEEMFSRYSPYPQRRIAQQKLNLPLLPTTTIGSFPQTQDIRKARSDQKKGILSEAAYHAAMEREIETVIRFQEREGLDVLVHGEPERNDMVEYFGQMLNGFTFTQNGWVQSYGSRCVKPPVIYGDVSRPAPMTVEWSRYAQSLSSKHVKGMLTGPITILQWSFVREDQPRRDTAWQIALAIRDEVKDLETAGIQIIQIDEPALREGVPLRKTDWPVYFDWAVKAFRLATCTVSDSTQIHTHMCYSDFNEIIKAIAALDADVISIEASRSDVELLDVFVHYNYPNEIGPGVYDIHSPRVPSVEEMKTLLRKMIKVLRPEQTWVNPDCGLKTRTWPEVEQSLKNMVQAAQALRAELNSDSGRV